MASLSRASKYRRLAAALRSIDKQFTDGLSDEADYNGYAATGVHSAEQLPENIGSIQSDVHSVGTEDSDLSSVCSWGCSTCFTSSSDDASDPENDSGTPQEPPYNDFDRSERSTSNVRSALREWFMEFDVSQASLRGLLYKLKPFVDELPSDPRTIVGNLHSPSVHPMGSGHFVNFGLKNQLHLALCKRPFTENTVFLTFHVDGLPIFKSSGLDLWPILFTMFHAPDFPPSVVCIYAGKHKAKLGDFLKDFTVELQDLLQNGIQVKGKYYSVKVRCFVCDAPARAYIKGIQGHAGFCACEHSIQVGYKDMGRTVFPRMNAPKRTDESFVAQTQRGHHNEHSPLTDLGICMVSQFPLDYMHLVLQGVVRTFVIMWVLGKKPYKLKNDDIKKMDEIIAEVKKMWPMDFSRKPRSLLEAMRWKATEFRQFILYLCVAILKCSLTDRCYSHFLLLHCAITILCREDLHATKLHHAEKFLRKFFAQLPEFYGSHFQYYNFHSLIHLTDCARAYGVLDSFSAFPFENFLHTLKRYTKSHQCPLESLVNRLSGKAAAGVTPGLSSKKPPDNGPMQSSSHCNGPTSYISGRQYTKFHLHGFRISTRPGDSCISFKNGGVGIVQNFVVNSSGTFVVAVLFRRKYDAYVYPCKSSTLGIYKVSDLGARPLPIPIADIACKNVLIPFHSKDYQLVVPIRT